MEVYFSRFFATAKDIPSDETITYTLYTIFIFEFCCVQKSFQEKLVLKEGLKEADEPFSPIKS